MVSMCECIFIRSLSLTIFIIANVDVLLWLLFCHTIPLCFIRPIISRELEHNICLLCFNMDVYSSPFHTLYSLHFNGHVVFNHLLILATCCMLFCVLVFSGFFLVLFMQQQFVIRHKYNDVLHLQCKQTGFLLYLCACMAHVHTYMHMHQSIAGILIKTTVLHTVKLSAVLHVNKVPKK